MTKRIISIIITAALFASCSKQKLDPIPQTALSDANAFSDSARCIQQINGAYSALKFGQMYAGRYQVYQDVRGEDFLNVTNNAVTAWLTWQFNLTPSANEVQNFWSSAYTCINRCNVGIPGIQGAPIRDELKLQLVAELKTIRAIAYFTLLQLYARPYSEANGSQPGLPLRLSPETSAGNNDMPRSTVAEVYDQILRDLNEAETDLVSDYGTALLNTTRAHKNTAIALKTRVYLNMGNWAQVIAEGNKIVPAAAPWQSPARVANRLMPTIATVFQSPYTTAESILSMPFQALDLPGTQNGLGHYFNPGPDGNGDFSLNTTGNGILADAGWRSTDARRNFNVVASGRTWLRKWPNNPGSNPDWSPVIRYAEVLLNVAEAEARSNASVSARALAILNAVRKRSDPTIADFAPATATELVNRILTERRIELLGEGFRSSDVARLRQNFRSKGVVAEVPYEANAYLWPIPLSEILVNRAIQQNPGY